MGQAGGISLKAALVPTPRYAQKKSKLSPERKGVSCDTGAMNTTACPQTLPQLVLIPGLAGDATMWQALQPTLPAALRPVVAMAHARPAAARIEDMAALLLAEHAGPLLLCGASMGGMIAMEAARQAPARVAGLALLGTTARPETPDMRALREAAMDLFAQGRLREVIEPNVAFAFHPASAARPELVRAYLDFVLRAGAAQLVRQNRAVIHRPDARLHLPQVACPVLVVCGTSSLRRNALPRLRRWSAGPSTRCCPTAATC